MKKTLIIYNSHTGITKKYAEDIQTYLVGKNLETKLISIAEFNNTTNIECDLLMLGSWTSGLFFFGQHPDKEWVKFAQKLPKAVNSEIILFTTYKLATGSMFKNMKKHLGINSSNVKAELKSRKGNLSESDKSILGEFVK
jgi:flavodoxin